MPVQIISFAKISDTGTAVADGVVNYGTETPVSGTAQAAQRLVAIVGDGDTIGEPGERGFVLGRYGDAMWLNPFLTENTAADPLLIRTHGQRTSTAAGDISTDALRFHATNGFGVGNYTEASGKWGMLNAGDAVDFRLNPVDGQPRILDRIAFTIDMQGQTGTVTLALDGDGSFLVRSGNAWTTNAAAQITGLANNSNVVIDVANRVVTVNGVTQNVPNLWTALTAAGNDNITIGAPHNETRGFSLRNLVITTNDAAPPPNRAPVANADTYATLNTAALVVGGTGVLGNDSDPDGNAITASVVTGPVGGTLALNPNGSFTYTPNSGFEGADSFTYRASDGTLQSTPATVTINVTAPPPNRPPVANADNYATLNNAPLVVGGTGVLGNDSDPDGNAITATAVTGPASGTLALNPNGSFTYTPNSSFEGTDSFTYQASDGTLQSAPATVTINVTAPNTIPVANPDTYGTNEDTPLTVPVAAGVLGNDTDADGHPLTAALVTGAARGVVALNADGSFTYTPNANANGQDSFTYRVNDGRANSAPATVTINVAPSNDTPVLAAPLADQTGTVSTPFSYVVPSGAFTDPDAGDTLTLTATLLNGDPLPAWLGFTPGTRTFSGTPPTAAAIDIVVTATDSGGLAASDTFRLTTSTAPPAPASRISFAKISDTGTAVADGVINYGTETPVSGTALAAQRLIAIVGDGDGIGEPGERGFVLGRYGDAIWLDPFLSENTAADPVLIRSHGQTTSTAAGDISSDALRFHATNGFGVGNYTEASGKWGLLNAGDAVDFQVTPVNGQARRIETLAFTIDMQGQTGTVTLALDGDGSFLVRSGNAWTTNAAATFANLANNTNVFIDVVNRVITFNGVAQTVPNALWTALTNAGGDNITIGTPHTETRGFSLRNLVISASEPAPPPNRAPVGVNDAYTVGFNSTLNVAGAGVLANDTDADGNPLTAILVSNATNGAVTLNANGSFSYTPATGYRGQDSFTYRASDGNLDSGVTTVSLDIGQGRIAFESTESSIAETGGTAFVAITRSGDLDYRAVVDYGVTSNTATAGQDFIGGTGQAIFEPGVSRVLIPVTILDDQLSEPTEAFAVSIITVDSRSLIFVPRTTRVNIIDNETPPNDPVDPPLTSNYNVTEQTVIPGLTGPMALEFHPLDSSIIFVAQKGGRLRVFDTDTNAFLPDFVNLTAKVNDQEDRGLIDIALHPDFVNHPYIYAFYVVDPPGTTGSGNAGPDGAGNRYAHVVRFTADVATNYTTMVPGSELVIVGAAGQSRADISGQGAVDSTNDFNQPESGLTNGVYRDNYIKVDSVSHAGGALLFGPDGKLYVSIGDGTSFNAVDNRSFSVQSLDSLAGKILRIDPITGQGLPDNPFFSDGMSLDANRAKVFQLGFRNPFSMAFDQNGRLIVSNTGWNTWEEIETGPPGANFGWPYYEGGDGVNLRAPGYQSLYSGSQVGYNGLPSPSAFYASVAAGTTVITPAFRGFGHADSAPGFQNSGITAGDVVYTGNRYPAEFLNDFFFTDVTDGQVFVVDVNNNRDLKYLYTSQGGPVYFTEGPDGYVYYANYFNGTVGRLLITPKAGTQALTAAKEGEPQPEVSLASQPMEASADWFNFDASDKTAQPEAEVCEVADMIVAAKYADIADVCATGFDAPAEAAIADAPDFTDAAPSITMVRALGMDLPLEL